MTTPKAEIPDSDPLAEARRDPRVLYAAERTYLAWIRTGLALMGFGFVVARFGLFLRELMAAKSEGAVSHSPRLSLWVGVAFVLLGVGIHLAASWRHREILHRLNPPAPSDWRWSSAVVLLGVILALMGLLLAGYLIYTH